MLSVVMRSLAYWLRWYNVSKHPATPTFGTPFARMGVVWGVAKLLVIYIAACTCLWSVVSRTRRSLSTLVWPARLHLVVLATLDRLFSYITVMWLHRDSSLSAPAKVSIAQHIYRDIIGIYPHGWGFVWVNEWHNIIIIMMDHSLFWALLPSVLASVSIWLCLEGWIKLLTSSGL